jgi:ribonuclease BN (tRNA processing enzyme)
MLQVHDVSAGWLKVTLGAAIVGEGGCRLSAHWLTSTIGIDGVQEHVMQLKVLGCSGGIGGLRRTMSLLLGQDTLIDAGSGVGDLSLDEMLRIQRVFLTHSHLDHVGFLPLLADAAVSFRAGPLIVYACPETIDAVRSCMFDGRLWPDYTALPTPEAPYIQFRKIGPSEAVSIEGATVSTLPVRHSVPGVGYRIDSGQSSFVYSGDTTFTDEFWTALEGIGNLRYLMIECTFLDAAADAARRGGHMTPALIERGLALLSRRPRLLIAHLEPGQREASVDEVTKRLAWADPHIMEEGEVFDF